MFRSFARELNFVCLIRELFLELQRRKYFKSIAQALVDFQELNPTSPVHMLVDNLNSKKTLPLDTLPTWLRNLSEYMQCVPMDAGIGSSFWSQVVQGIETLFRRIILSLPTLEEPTYLLDIMVCLLKVPGISKVKSEDFSNISQSKRFISGSVGTVLKDFESLHSEFDCEVQSVDRFKFSKC